MGCLRLTYYPSFEVLKGGSKKELTSKKSVSNLRSVYIYGYNGMEKDDEVSGGGNSYDYGARQYNNRLGRWMSQDPLKVMYPSMSPYCYAGNSPIACYDPDGNLIIFINGACGSSQEKAGGSEYWGAILKTIEEATGVKMDRVSGNSKKIKHVKGPNKSKFSENKQFLFVAGNTSSLPDARKKEGKAQAKLDADDIWKQLKTTMVDGKITEQIQMISHSKGVAFGEGYIEQIILELQKRADQEKITFAYGKDDIVEYHLGLAPHQSDYLDAHHTTSVYITHDWDIWSDDDAQGTVLNIASTAPSGSGGSHDLPSFNRELKFVLNILENSRSKYSERLKAWYKDYDKNTGTQTEFTTGKENEEACEDEGEFSYTTN
ncbi:MAG: hypothetical protein RL494_318 [Bacteroidota bacterium]|jgi:RHS repeat-associated protein